MKIFFVSQGAGLEVFHRTAEALAALTSIESVSHYVADQMWVEQYLSTTGPISKLGILLREWDIVSKGRDRRPSWQEVEEVERRLGIPSLWPVLVADRRMMNGPQSKLRQDYAPSYSHAELQGIAVELAEILESSYRQIHPDLVISFGPATVGGVMADLVARSLQIPVLTLKSTKISNYVTLGDGFREEHPHIRKAFKCVRKAYPNLNSELLAQARELINTAKKSRISYEGVTRSQPKANWFCGVWRFLTGLPRAVTVDLRTKFRGGLRDPQFVSRIVWLWEGNIGAGRRVARQQCIVSDRTLDLDGLEQAPFIFFPLNSEPEISLSVYSRFTLNQIEVVRNVAQSIPLGWRVILKEHPRSYGRRSDGYYRRLMEIPNVWFVPVEISPQAIFPLARATVVISSFMGFESILSGVPCVAFGETLFSCLPPPFYWRVDNVEKLPELIARITREQWPDDHQEWIESFLVAVMEQSVRMDLYGCMLRKRERERGSGNDASDALDVQYRAFAAFILKRFYEIRGAH